MLLEFWTSAGEAAEAGFFRALVVGLSDEGDADAVFLVLAVLAARVLPSFLGEVDLVSDLFGEGSFFTADFLEEAVFLAGASLALAVDFLVDLAGVFLAIGRRGLRGQETV